MPPYASAPTAPRLRLRLESAEHRKIHTQVTCGRGVLDAPSSSATPSRRRRVDGISSHRCDSNEGFWAEVQSWLIPQFAGDIYGAVNAPIEDAINGEFTTLVDDYNLDTCGSS